MNENFGLPTYLFTLGVILYQRINCMNWAPHRAEAGHSALSARAVDSLLRHRHHVGVGAAAAHRDHRRRGRLKPPPRVVDEVEVLPAVLDWVDRLAAHDGVRVEVGQPHLSSSSGF